MKRICTLFVFLACFLSSFAYDAVVDGIYYDLVPKAKIAKVTRGDNKYSGEVVIPEHFRLEGIEYTVTEIIKDAFRYCSKLISVSMPNTVTNIGEYAFYECKVLTSVTLSNNLINIGLSAFDACANLTSISIPASVTRINSSFSSGCPKLKSVHISDIAAWCNIDQGYHSFSSPYNLFLNDSLITDLIIPNSITEIKNEAFRYCTGITSITLPNSVTSIGESAFSYCSELTSVTIPNSVTSIGESAFYHSGLTSVTIPNSVTRIGESAFSGCSELTSVTIPNSITYLYYAFVGCTGLTSVTIPNSVTSITGAFQGCTGLTSVTIPNSIETTINGAFRGCSGLTSVAIPNSVTWINDREFEGCTGLTSVYIPNSVTGIGISAFSNCMNLADVYCECETPPSLYSNVFYNVYPEYSTLHVPESAIDSYRTADQWKDFGKIVTLETGETPAPKQCAAPTIVVENGKVSFTCETEGVEFISEVKENCTKNYYSSSFSFAPIYTISVYATKTGYVNSEIVKKTVDLSSGGGVKGDMNEDGQITVADVTELVNAVLEKK